MVEKIKDNLFYDERSAGGIVYRQENNGVKWLLIKALKRFSKERKAVWKFPKGHLQRDEFLKEAAIREVEEEGRVKAEVVTKLGSNNYIIWDKIGRKKIVKKVTFFLMKFLEESKLKYFDKEMVVDREWFEYEEALEKLDYDSEKILLKKAKQRLKYIKIG
jgi:ADP-ribose pyrophosphatase YjhB (NUDIX family)